VETHYPSADAIQKSEMLRLKASLDFGVQKPKIAKGTASRWLRESDRFEETR